MRRRQNRIGVGGRGGEALRSFEAVPANRKTGRFTGKEGVEEVSSCLFWTVEQVLVLCCVTVRLGPAYNANLCGGWGTEYGNGWLQYRGFGGFLRILRLDDVGHCLPSEFAQM